MQYLIPLAMFIAVACGAVPALAQTLEERAIFAALAQERPWYEPGSTAQGALESREAYDERVGASATALVSEGTYVDDKGRVRSHPDWRWGARALVASVLAHWYEESRFALEVHAGTEHPVWTQDRGRARCFGQLHVGLVPEADWARLAGVDAEATRRCATWTIRALIRMAQHCAPRGAKVEQALLPMFSGLSGSGCAPTLSARRKVERFAKIWRALDETPRPPPPPAEQVASTVE